MLIRWAIGESCFMPKNKPVFFDESGKRQKIVDFILLLLIFIIAFGGTLMVYYIRRISLIERKVHTVQNKPPTSNTTVLYTEANSASYTVLGDQIQKIGNLLIPKYLVSNNGITTPLAYEKLKKSVKEQSTNINTNYSTYYILSSQDFAKQPIERRSVQVVDASLPSLITVDQMSEIAIGLSNDDVSGLYINLDMSAVKTPQQVQQYALWLDKFKTKISEQGLHLGLLVDPGTLNDVNHSLIAKTELVYFGQSKYPTDKQLNGLKYSRTVNEKNVTIEVPTASTKTDTRITSHSITNIDYRSIDELLFDKQINRSNTEFTVKDGAFVYGVNDAVTDYNFMRSVSTVRDNKPTNYAVSDPGFEEYTLWKMLNYKFGDKSIISLLSEEAASGLIITERGSGQVYSIEDKALPGERKLTFDSQNNIIGSVLVKLDTANTVVRQGQQSKKIALTFDDGPNPTYTPKIMSILESYGVRGTFFVTGQNVLTHPETARAIVARGHEIENHTFTHPVFSLLTPESNRSQIGSTNEIIQEVTGVRPHYFRKPYSDRNEASNTGDVAYLTLLRELGMQASEYDIDSKDWQLPTSDQIVNHVKTQFQASNGHYSQILLHDAHQNPELTLQALPKIIEYIKSQGIDIVTVNQLSNQYSGPKEVTTSKPYRALQAQRGLLGVATWLSIVFIALAFIRYAWMIVGSIFYSIKYGLLHFLSRNMSLHRGTLPRLAIIIACYNEEKVIGKTIEALQQGTYRNFRLILVNDGSRDDTASIIRGYAEKDRRITLVDIPNGGKANALEQGMARTKNRWLVFCDADTIFAPNALYEFALAAAIDNRLGAIAAKIIVGNDHNLLTRSQLIEYEIAYKFIKSSQDVTNMITVVPGAAGLWKHGALEKAGGFLSDTLAEDADTTMRVISRGSRVGYRANVRAFTEVPEKIKMLFKQRTRWQLGNMQSFVKHRRGLLNHRYGTLGFVGLPMFFIELLAAITYPFILIFTVIMLFNHGSTSIGRLKEVITNPATDYAVFLGIALVTVEVLLVLFVVLTVKKSLWAKFKLLLTIPYFVTIYKIFLSLFTLVALLRALRGRMHGWGHLQRTGTANAAINR